MTNCSYFLSHLITQNEFIFGSIILLTLLAWGLLSVAQDRVEYILSGIVIGGALLNLIERVLFGCVSDPFNFFNLFHFNVADLAISVGVLTLAYRLLIKPFSH
jgi:lipoprotein signal peptidase